MTDCNSEPLHFSPLNSKKVCGNFDGGTITSDAGALLLREIDQSMQITKRFASVITDTRNPNYVEHTTEALLKQRAYALALGYADVNDHDELRLDEGFQCAVGREVSLGAHSTLSRFENSLTRADCVELNKMFVEHFIAKQTSAPKELILDFDPTDAKLYGKQQQRFYHGYYGEYCFLPLHVFCGDDLLVSYLRPCNIDGSKHAGAILKLLVKRFRKVWPNVKIIFRGDGAFARKRILYWCEHNRVKYVVGMSSNARLKKIAEPTCQTAKTKYEETNEKQRIFSEIQYAAHSWHAERRVVFKAEHHSKGENCRFILTNLKDDPQTVYDQRYCLRGEMENKIKQQKLDLSSDRMSCHQFMANQARALFSGIAYILVTELREKALKGTQLAKAYCQTIREKCFKIGAVVIKNTRRIQYYFASHHPYQELFRHAMGQLKPT